MSDRTMLFSTAREDTTQEPAAEAEADAAVLDDLVRSAELLQSNRPTDARVILERALGLNPTSIRVQNMLALAYFKLGLFDLAETLYRDLLREHPEDASLLVNLGLVYLKLRRSDEAIKVFEGALREQPDHPKAANYLGLAHAQRGDSARAREWFERAGNAAMVDRMASQATVAMQSLGDAAIAALESSDQPFGPAAASTGTSGGWKAVKTGSFPRVVPTPAPPHPVDTLDPAPAREIPLFEVTPSVLRIRVDGGLFARVDGLIASFGQLEFKTVFKRFRGKPTEKLFGDSDRRLFLATGSGQLWIGTSERRFEVLKVEETPTFVREDALFAFESGMDFENGRIASKEAGDIPLVNMKSSGTVLLSLKRGLRRAEVTRETPCQAPIEVLLGWQGTLTPRIVVIGDDNGNLPTVELSGTGHVLLDAGF